MAKGRKTGGRQKGSTNKTTTSVKASLAHVYALSGGDEALLAWRNENPSEFYRLWGRMLPAEVSGPDGGPIEVKGVVILPPLVAE